MRRVISILLGITLAACSRIDGTAWNDPYPASDRGQNILYSVFTERPKHLDPVQSYSENEIIFHAQIYEPPLQYHYLKRPYTVVPATATEVPQPRYFDATDKPLPNNAAAASIAYSEYVIHIKPGIRYQPHPAFASSKENTLSITGRILCCSITRHRSSRSRRLPVAIGWNLAWLMKTDQKSMPLSAVASAPTNETWPP